jgi:hypothetical protein
MTSDRKWLSAGEVARNVGQTAGLEADLVGLEDAQQHLCRRTPFDTVGGVVIREGRRRVQRLPIQVSDGVWVTVGSGELNRRLRPPEIVMVLGLL